jgi:hypothetical protein
VEANVTVGQHGGLLVHEQKRFTRPQRRVAVALRHDELRAEVHNQPNRIIPVSGKRGCARQARRRAGAGGDARAGQGL